MNIQETTALIAYINGLDPLFTADATRAAAWHSFLPPNINYHGAKAAVDHHYSTTRNTIKPRDILDYQPAKTQPYHGGTKPFCGQCQDGYIITPLPPNPKGFVFNNVNFCKCQIDATKPREILANPRSIFYTTDDL
jgi:hypothetical protein